MASDLCTRFATQIVLRRTSSDEAGAKITIIPGPAAQQDEAQEEKLKSFETVLEADKFDSDEFGRVFDQVRALHSYFVCYADSFQAAEAMGIPGPGTTDLESIEKRFSDDILKIELSGPDHHHLSVVDVPGLFHSMLSSIMFSQLLTSTDPTKYQTEEDKGIIRSLIQNYIVDKRTIILFVLPAVCKESS